MLLHDKFKNYIFLLASILLISSCEKPSLNAEEFFDYTNFSLSGSHYGFNISASNPKSISEFLIKLAENKSWKLRMSQNAKKAYEKHFSIETIFSKWSKILFYK